MEKIRVGIIGTGFIGPVHIDALRRLGFVEIAAVSEVSEALAKQKAEQLGISKAYGDYRELLRDKELDAVHICTPNHLHFQIAKEALQAGKHVLCEKPLSMDYREAQELLGIAGQHPELFCGVDFNIRFYPLIQQIKSMIHAGELGKILAVNGSYQQDWLFYQTDYSWRLQPQFSGKSRAVSDIGSHWMDVVEYVTGIRITEVCGDFATFHPVRKKPLKPIETYSGKILANNDYVDVPIQTEDYATVLLRFGNGAHGSMTVNQVAAGRKNRLYFEIYGDKKAAAWDSENPNELWIGRRDGNNEQMIKDPSLFNAQARPSATLPGGHTEGFYDTTKLLFGNFYRAVLSQDRRVDYPTFQDGARDILLCDRICLSAEKGAWVTI